ncbi:hypothetical protein QUG21_24955, partial [Escherichia coli]|uniref:hypothetical protein n=1 Tax=Escherichia coli TaxID=562 RepID=UPI0025A23B06
MDETTDKEKAGNSPACPDLYSLIFRLTIYIAQMLSNLTVCFERGADVDNGLFSLLNEYYIH